MNAKQLAAEKAVTYVQNGMTLGLGSGSTSAFAIEAVGRMVSGGLSIKAVASSLRSEELARSAGIEIVSFAEVDAIDLYIDGADEVDKNFNLVKGGGGALLREKILAFNSRSFIVIVDDTKLVDQLGRFPLPVEITPFAAELTIRQLQKLHCATRLRQKDETTFITDNGNLIVDCSFGAIADTADMNQIIHHIPGVVETGLFSHTIVSRLIIGHENGTVEEQLVNKRTD